MNTYSDILEKIIYLTIATVDADGQPWNTPVFGAYDENNNFYWGSHSNSQHSKNIRANSNVFLVIYDSTMEAGTGEGVYVKAKATELKDPAEIASAHQLLQTRRPTPYWKLDEVQPDMPVHLYKAVPEKLWRNSEGQVDGIYIDTLEEIS